jgi:hypothetical protein
MNNVCLYRKPGENQKMHSHMDIKQSESWSKKEQCGWKGNRQDTEGKRIVCLFQRVFRSCISTQGEENTVLREKENLVNFCTRETDLIHWSLTSTSFSLPLSDDLLDIGLWFVFCWVTPHSPLLCYRPLVYTCLTNLLSLQLKEQAMENGNNTTTTVWTPLLIPATSTMVSTRSTVNVQEMSWWDANVF